ncbi:hypothetical protein GCM10020367_08630 [Streptomyces sannanensis]|uniref:Uncharacterized protein n=1 Tax=Streptomyces sannanensis TaxID=285536 RepID=A0ABP6S5W4_9ACTN
MSTPPATPGSVRPDAALANERIRALVDERADEAWPAEEYELLLLEWAAATQGCVTAAA